MIFEHLRLIDDPISGDGAWNMAVDEMLTQEVKKPVLRVYGWAQPTVTLGYFEKIADARRLWPGLPLMRRWTGGGLVEHGADWTYSLVVPATHPWAQMSREESYWAIHRVVQRFFLANNGLALELADVSATQGEGCFARPVRGDLLYGGKKIAGAAQRRTQSCLLHQGSIQGVSMTMEDATGFAEVLAQVVDNEPLSPEEHYRATAISAGRYELKSWLERR